VLADPQQRAGPPSNPQNRDTVRDRQKSSCSKFIEFFDRFEQDRTLTLPHQKPHAHEATQNPATRGANPPSPDTLNATPSPPAVLRPLYNRFLKRADGQAKRNLANGFWGCVNYAVNLARVVLMVPVLLATIGKESFGIYILASTISKLYRTPNG